MRKLVKIFIFSLLINTISYYTYSQQLPQYTQWATHQFSINPAHAGIKACVDIQTLYRTQWVGIEGAPKSGFFTLSVPLQINRTNYLSARHGIGVKVETDKIGQFTTNRFNLAYAGHVNFSRDTRLSVGISLGMMHFGYDQSNSKTIDPDPAIFSEASLVMPDASVGAWWNGANYYFGASLQNLMRSKWKGVGLDSRYRIQTSINAGNKLKISDDVNLLSGVLFKIPTTGPLGVDANAIFDFKNIFGIGGGYRFTEAILGFMYFKISQQFLIQYSVDYVVSPLGRSFSHEISFNFATCKSVSTGAIKTALFE